MAPKLHITGQVTLTMETQLLSVLETEVQEGFCWFLIKSSGLVGGHFVSVDSYIFCLGKERAGSGDTHLECQHIQRQVDLCGSL